MPPLEIQYEYSSASRFKVLQPAASLLLMLLVSYAWTLQLAPAI